MRTHRFGRKLKLPSTIAIKHQIRMLMFEDALKVIVQPYLEPYLGGDSFEAVRIGGFDKRCGV